FRRACALLHAYDILTTHSRPTAEESSSRKAASCTKALEAVHRTAASARPAEDPKIVEPRRRTGSWWSKGGVMNCFFRLALALTALDCVSLSGCATIVKGSTQDLNVTTDPPGASCDLSRGGTVIATVNPTPGQVQIKKDKNDIDVKCKKSGFTETTGHISSN